MAAGEPLNAVEASTVIILTMVSFLVGAVLGQHFRVMILMPAIVIVLIVAVVTGVTHAHAAWSIVLMAVASATSIQIGYLVGIGIRHLLAVAPSSRSSSLPPHTASMSARHPAR
jgi:hypothetical protein